MELPMAAICERPVASDSPTADAFEKPAEEVDPAALPRGIRAIVASDFLWVGDADLPHSARAAYGAAVNGLMATDQLVRIQTTDSDKTLAMLVGLRDDQVSLDVARIALK